MAKSCIQLDLNKISLQHGYGYPIHMSVLSHKFDTTLLMMENNDTRYLSNVDYHVLNTIGANIVHLLLVKYDKDTKLGKEVLKKCV